MAFNDISLLPDLLDALKKERKGLIVPLCNTVFKLLKNKKKVVFLEILVGFLLG
jgi:hypothetical protein